MFAKRPMVCVTGERGQYSVAGKLEASKMLENGDESPPSNARFVSPFSHLPTTQRKLFFVVVLARDHQM